MINQPEIFTGQSATDRIRIRLETARDRLSDQHRAAVGQEVLNGWLVSALEDLLVRADTRKRMFPLLSEDPEVSMALIDVLEALGQRGFAGMNTEAFSIWLFDDSRYFTNNIEKHLLPIILQFHPRLAQTPSSVSNEAALALVGLHMTSETLEFCGPVTLLMDSGELDFSRLPSGVCLKTESMPSVRSVDASRVRRVLFVEHKANYEQLLRDGLPPDELAIWHGSVLSHQRETFLAKLTAGLPEDCLVIFWGDIDLGGFSHYLALKRLLDRPVECWRMDQESLLAMKDRAVEISPRYRRKLENARRNPFFLPVAGMIDYMLETGIRLRQDAYLPRRESADKT